MAVPNILLLVALVSNCACSDKNAPKSGMHCFELPKTIAVGDLRVRKLRPEGWDLLIDRAGVHFYDHEEKSLTQVESIRWKEATGVVTDYAARGTVDKNVIPGELDHKLILHYKRAGNRQIPTKGQWVMRVSFSAEGRLLAALTRDKEPKKDMKAPGTHYVELFTYPEGKPVGRPYELPFTDFNNIDPLCWSSGDTYLIVSTVDGRHVCIIEVPDQKEEGKRKDEG